MLADIVVRQPYWLTNDECQRIVRMPPHVGREQIALGFPGEVWKRRVIGRVLSLFQSNAMQQIQEPRIAPNGVIHWIHFDLHHRIRVFRVRLPQ